ncbi:MAG: hypothetical protein ACYCY1_16220 [Sulfuriferula sp.]
MDGKSIISAKNSCRAAQTFNLFSISAILAAPLLLLWIAVSILVNALIAQHPNAKVATYNRWAGYRFYGIAGSLMVFRNLIYHIFCNWHGLLAIWMIRFTVVDPWGIWAVVKTGKEEWSERQIGTALSDVGTIATMEIPDSL